jgi:hypothetical protein
LAKGIPARLTPAEGRRFGLVVGGAFLLLGALSLWRGHEIAPTILWAIGGALVAAGLVVPAQLGPVYRKWMGLALLLSRVTTPIFMGLVYFGLFTPLGVARRLLGWNSLVRAPADSFWAGRESRRSNLHRQF